MNCKKLSLASAAAIITLSLAAPAIATDAIAEQKKPVSAKAEMINIKGDSIGEIVLGETKNGVVLLYGLHNLPAGEHSMHIHETGNCTPVQTENETGSVKYFSNAYGHLNPDKKSHGFLDDNGPHAGDLPNFIVDSSNNAFGHIYNNRITIKDDNKNSGKAVLLDDDGAAITIHSGQDDYATQPTGAAGSRIACGVIKAE
jgi:Cu-Zn family superoxide dismutase